MIFSEAIHGYATVPGPSEKGSYCCISWIQELAASRGGRNASASRLHLLSLTEGDRHGPTDDPSGQRQGSEVAV